MSRRLIVLLALVGAVITVSFVAYFWSSDEDQIRKRVDELAQSASFSEGTNPLFYSIELKGVLKKSLTPQAAVTAEELGISPLGGNELADRAAAFVTGYRSVTVMVAGLKIDIVGAKATATGRLILSARGNGADIRLEQRTVRFELDKVDGKWLISRVVVTPLP